MSSCWLYLVSGVPVAYEIASVLRVPMDVFIVRKLGVPGEGSWRWVQSLQVVCACSRVSWG
jgi:hypothetical protein